MGYPLSVVSKTKSKLCLDVEFDRMRVEPCERFCDNGGLTVKSRSMVLARLRALMSMGQCEIV